MHIRLKNLTLVLGSFLLLAGCAKQSATVGATQPADSSGGSGPKTSTETSPPTEVYTFVEEMPQFPGGAAALMDFLAKQTVYPKDAREAGLEGRVMVQFTVLRNGTLHGAEVVRGISPSLDQEALRVIGLMPKWKPGRQNGNPVAVRYMLPISFQLD